MASLSVFLKAQETHLFIRLYVLESKIFFVLYTVRDNIVRDTFLLTTFWTSRGGKGQVEQTCCSGFSRLKDIRKLSRDFLSSSPKLFLTVSLKLKQLFITI